MSGFARDVHTISVALGQVAVGLVQLTYYTTVGTAEGLRWVLASEAPDRSQDVPLESRIIDGRPVVRWLADDGNDFGESFSGWYTYEGIVTKQYHATIDDLGRFVVTCQPLYGTYVWKHPEPTAEPESCEGMDGIEPNIAVVCCMDAAHLRGFTIESNMRDLNTVEAAKYRANRLWYTEHQCIRASFDGGETGILSTCQRGIGHTQDVVYALNRMFSGAKSTRGQPTPSDAPRKPVII